MSVIVVGTAGYNTIETPGGAVREVLGGSAIFFALGAGFFSPVSLVSAVGDDFKSEDRQLLAERNVDLRAMVSRAGPSFRWHGRYQAGGRTDTIALEPGVFDNFEPVLLPDQRQADYVFMAKLPPRVQAHVVDQLNRPKLVAAETMEHWIASRRDELIKSLTRVNVILLSEVEARRLAGDHSLLRAGRAIRAMGPHTVLITRGDHGVLQFTAEGVFAAPAYPVEEVMDPTGAGDTFAGAFVGYLARHGRIDEGTLRPAALYALVVASFVVEDFSTRRLLTLTWEEIDQRYRDYLALTDHHQSRRIAP